MSQDCGTLGDTEWSGSLSSSCDASSNWTAAAAITANGSTNEEWGQISYNGTNDWKFNFHFRERPENLYQDNCPNDGKTWMKPRPHNFNFSIYTPSYEDTSDLYFESWDPQDQDGDGSGDNETNLTLDIIDGVGGPYTAIGTAVIDYLVSGNETVTVDSTSLDTDLTFDVPLKGDYTDLPREMSNETKSAEVAVRVKNEYSSGEHSVYFMPKYTFSYKYSDENQCFDCGTYTTHYKSVAPDYPVIGTYESV